MSAKRGTPVGRAAMWFLFGRDANEVRKLGREVKGAAGQIARAGVAAGTFGAMYLGDTDKVRTAAMMSDLRPEGGPYVTELKHQKSKMPKRVDYCMFCGRELSDDQGVGELCAYCSTDPTMYEVIE